MSVQLFNFCLLHQPSAVPFQDSLAEAVKLCSIAKPCHHPMLNSDKKKFLPAHKTFNLASYIVVGFALPVGDADGNS